MTENEVAKGLRALSHEARKRVLAPYICKPRDEFGLTELERDYAEALILFEDEGMDAALSAFPTVNARKCTFQSITEDRHYYTKIRTTAKAIRKSRISNPRRLVESDHLDSNHPTTGVTNGRTSIRKNS